MFKNFFRHLDIEPRNVHILNGNAPDPEVECANYEEEILKAGGIDMFIGGMILECEVHLYKSTVVKQAAL